MISDVLYTFDGKHLYRGRFTNLADVLYTWDGKHLYKGRFTNMSDVSGIAPSGYAYLSYSVMNSSSSSFYGIGKNMRGQDCATTSSRDGSGTNFKSNCTDITTFLQECYSSYAGYWDFGSSWIWQGTINGKEVSVSCPRLAWEQ